MPAPSAQASAAPRVHRIVESASIVTLLAAIAWGAWRVAADLHGARLAWAAVAVFLGYLAADLASGVVHWLGDRYGSPQMPVLGQAFIQPFRRHHVAPKEMTEHDFIEINGNNSIVTLPVVGVAYAVFPLAPTWGLVGFCATVSLAAWVFATNQIHAWSHMDRLPPGVATLQRWGVILAPDHHDVHHTPPYQTYYCITSGLLNPLAHRLRLWARLETVMRVVLSISPYREPDAGADVA